MELLYLSFTTLTSVGLSDIVPVKPFARGVVMIEQLAGIGYIAILVSRLIGLTIHKAASCGAELDVVDLAQDLADRGLGVAEQQRGLRVVEERVVDAREAR